MQSASELLKDQQRHRLIKHHVPEAEKYARGCCDQGCHCHLYFKEGIPYEQRTGLRHDCPIKEKALELIATYNMIQLSQVKPILENIQDQIRTLTNVIGYHEDQNREKAQKFKQEKRDKYYTNRGALK